MGVPGRGPGTWGQVIVAGAQSVADCVPGSGTAGVSGTVCNAGLAQRKAPCGFPRVTKPGTYSCQAPEGAVQSIQNEELEAQQFFIEPGALLTQLLSPLAGSFTVFLFHLLPSTPAPHPLKRPWVFSSL